MTPDSAIVAYLGVRVFYLSKTLLLAMGLLISETCLSSEAQVSESDEKQVDEEATDSPWQMKARKLKRYFNGSPESEEDENDDTTATHPESKNIYDKDTSIVDEKSQGWRKDLSEKGLDFSVLYKGEWSRVVKGGLERKNSFLGNLDLKLTLDGDKMGLSDTQVFAYALFDHGQHPSEAAGTAYGVSNLEVADRIFKLYELWVQHELFDKRLSVLLGIHDLNSEFYVTDSSGLFFNPTFGIGNEFAQTGVNGPSIFPNASPSIRLRYTPSKRFYFMAAAFNGEAGDTRAPKSSRYRINKKDGALVIYEAAYLPLSDEGETKYAVGTWSYTKKFELEAHPGETGYNQGSYLLVNQKISDSLSSFLRYGFAEEDLNEVLSNGSVGFVWKGFGESRPEDLLGLAFSTLDKSEHVRTADDEHAPATSFVEFTYKIDFGSGIAFQPNVQYFDYPANDKSPRSTTTLGARIELGF